MNVTTKTIDVQEVKTRLVELLDETHRGQSYDIVQQGQSIARLLPPLPSISNDLPQEIVAGYMSLQGTLKSDVPVDISKLRHQEHTFHWSWSPPA